MRRLLVITAALIAVGSGIYWLANRGELDISRLEIHEQASKLGSGNPQSNRIRILVGPNEPVRGANDALVTAVTFCDFALPECKHVARALFEATVAFHDSVRVVFKPLPVAEDARSLGAAKAALAAHAAGKFWEMHDLLFSEQHRLDAAGLEHHAERIGLSVESFRSAVRSEKVEAALGATVSYAARLGVGRAPAVFLNGLPISEPDFPFVAMERRIAAEIERARSLMSQRGIDEPEVYTELMRDARETPLRASSGRSAEDLPSAE